MVGALDQLVRLTQDTTVIFAAPGARMALCPALGGRVYAEVGGRLVHRVELDTVARPDRPFNNFGGNNFWPAPEGGAFAFNYRGNAWCVQPCINVQPFRTIRADFTGATIQKEVVLVNRAGVEVRALMTRELRLTPPPAWLAKYPSAAALSYTVRDSFELLNDVPSTQALIAAWTLEQFDATPDTVAFCLVRQPASAINFDFYAHPGKRIVYHQRGFAYRTDGQARGQIGIKIASSPRAIGFYDLSANLLCVRENCSAGEGTHFNIADNDQPQGPFSAADGYSIFNSDPDMRAFELETVGAAQVEQGLLTGSELVSTTTFLVFSNPAPIRAFLEDHLGPEEQRP